jgi:TonB family protein
MKYALAITALICALSFCNLIDRFVNRNQSEESSSSPNTNQSNVSSSPGAVSTPPSPPGSNQNGAAGDAGTTTSGGVLNGKAINKPDPAYPPVAKAARASGTVTVEVTVDETGKVISAKAVSGHPLLQAAAVQAAYQARFKPTLLSGKAVKVTGVLTYEFKPQ